jgi:hypothetical protein
MTFLTKWLNCIFCQTINSLKGKNAFAFKALENCHPKPNSCKCDIVFIWKSFENHKHMQLGTPSIIVFIQTGIHGNAHEWIEYKFWTLQLCIY